MAPKKKTSDKVPTGTSDAVDSGSTPNVAGGNDPTLDPGKDPSQAASAASETNTIHPTTRSTHVTNQLAQLASERGMSEDPTQSPNPHRGSRDLLLPKLTQITLSQELALGDQIQEMLDTINEHMDEMKTIHNMSCQAAQLLVKNNESNSALEARTRTLRTRLIAIREKYPTIAKGKLSSQPRDSTRDPNYEEINPHPEQPTSWSNNPVDEESTNGQPNIDHELMQSTPRPNNRADTKHTLSKAWTELSAKTAILEQLYADQAPEGHFNQAATAARNTCMEYDKNTRVNERQKNPHKSVHYAPFNGIEDNDTDSETTVRNHREGSVPFQHLDDRDILDMSNNEGNNPLVRMVKYMLDQNINTTMEKSPLAKVGVKVTPPDKYSGEQSFEALETFVSFLGTRLEGKALKWFDKTVEPRKYQGTPMNLEQVVTGLYGQHIPSLARHEASNRFDLIKQGMLSVQEFATELELYASQMVQRPDTYSLCKKFVDNLQPGLRSLLLCAGYDPEKKTIHKLYLKAVKLEDANHYDIGARNSEPMTSNSQQDDNVSSNARHKTRNNGPDRTKSRSDPPKSGEINKGPSITPGPSGVNRNSSTAPGGAGPPIHNRQQTNHKSSHNSIECYNCGKSGHIKPNCPEPIRAHCVGAVHVEDPSEGQVDNADFDINDNIDDEHLDEDKYRNDDHDLARIAAVVPIGPVNARKAKIAKEGEPLYDHTVKMKTNRPAQSKHDLLTITGYFLVGGTKARCLFDSGCEGIIMSSEFAFQGSRAKLYYTVTMDIIVGQRTYTEMFNIANIDYYDIMLGTPFLWMKGKSFETVRSELLVVPVPQTQEELKMLISLVAYMLPYCGHIKRPLDMLRCIYMNKPYVCNEDVYNVIIDINSALDTDTNVVNYYDDIVIKDGYLVHHKDNSYSTKATVSKSDYKTSLNGQNRTGVSIEEVNDEDDLHNIIKDTDIEDDNHILVDMETPPSHSFQN
ncbi:hypothetical protein M422DRAFT_253945 [Sphaerobolus stellatus SS14]|uniref:CCHC-type domain-containing protein n=1 Tax=Sphaerobolus stellatus (strain SS14) TaxID=990650 RepID=A0A0C9VVX2_SPHS4|nr:hypothetical protein M422DRAFT_253945 [Sphaerobolus stellatus SS14]